ncbi:MAG: aconitase/3-isopropylmalate dehydratase large subunit family protein [Chloroflexota bacterium]
MGRTIAEKILSRACGREVKAGEIVYPEPDLVVLTDTMVSHDGTTILADLKSWGVTRVQHPERLMISLGHTVPATTPRGAEVVKKVREVAAEIGIKNFFDEGCHGVEHIMPIQEGLARPGMLVFGGDTHMSTVGAVGALGIPTVYELESVLAFGTVWIRVPRTIRVILEGSLPPGLASRDLVLWVISDIGPERANYRVLEFAGSGAQSLSVEARMTLCNVPVQIGAKSAIVEPDEKTTGYVSARSREPFQAVRSDPDAGFEQTFRYDLSHLEPMVAAPPNPNNVKPVRALSGTRINQACVGSCANGTLEDVRAAAAVLRGRRVHAGVRMIVCPGTQRVFLEAAREGLIETVLAAGATVAEPGCSICYGASASLAASEVSIATITRNEPGRTGTFEADIYLASPATVAASAVKGEIADPREFL